MDEIYRPASPALPDAIADALLTLSLARERYRLAHAAGRGRAPEPRNGGPRG